MLDRINNKINKIIIVIKRKRLKMVRNIRRSNIRKSNTVVDDALDFIDGLFDGEVDDISEFDDYINEYTEFSNGTLTYPCGSQMEATVIAAEYDPETYKECFEGWKSWIEDEDILRIAKKYGFEEEEVEKSNRSNGKRNRIRKGKYDYSRPEEGKNYDEIYSDFKEGFSAVLDGKFDVSYDNGDNVFYINLEEYAPTGDVDEDVESQDVGDINLVVELKRNSHIKPGMGFMPFAGYDKNLVIIATNCVDEEGQLMEANPFIDQIDLNDSDAVDKAIVIVNDKYNEWKKIAREHGDYISDMYDDARKEGRSRV